MWVESQRRSERLRQWWPPPWPLSPPFPWPLFPWPPSLSLLSSLALGLADDDDGLADAESSVASSDLCTVKQNDVMASSLMLESPPAMPASLPRKPTWSCRSCATALDHAVQRPNAAGSMEADADGDGDGEVEGDGETDVEALGDGDADVESLGEGEGVGLPAANW